MLTLQATSERYSCHARPTCEFIGSSVCQVWVHYPSIAMAISVIISNGVQPRAVGVVWRDTIQTVIGCVTNHSNSPVHVLAGSPTEAPKQPRLYQHMHHPPHYTQHRKWSTKSTFAFKKPCMCTLHWTLGNHTKSQAGCNLLTTGIGVALPPCRERGCKVT